MKEWYMTGQTPDAAGGYESDAISEYAQSNFADVMKTTFSDAVVLYNYDLSVQTETQCVIQNNTADTQLKTMDRQILCPIGTIKAGMYIFYHNNFWLVTGRPDNNKSYEKSTLALCQYKLRWQKSDGTILERWCNMTSAAKYDVGESGNSTLVLTTNNFTLLVPNDEDSMTIESKRVFIDRNTKNPKKVFKITRNDDTIYDYGEYGGILNLIADKTEFSQEKDNTELMICDYISPIHPPIPDENPDKTTVHLVSLRYTGGSELKVGGNYKTITGAITDNNGNILDEIGVFEVITLDELNPYVKYNITSNTLKLKITDDESAIGGIIRVKFSTSDNTYSTYLDFIIISNY